MAKKDSKVPGKDKPKLPEEPRANWQQAKDKRFVDVTPADILSKATRCEEIATSLRAVADLMKRNGALKLTIEGGGKLERGMGIVQDFMDKVEITMVRLRQAQKKR